MSESSRININSSSTVLTQQSTLYYTNTVRSTKVNRIGSCYKNARGGGGGGGRGGGVVAVPGCIKSRVGVGSRNRR